MEVRGIEPRSEMVYRSSVYMLRYRIGFRLMLCPVTRLHQTSLLEFHMHSDRRRSACYPVLVGVPFSTDRQEAEGTA